MPETLLSTLYSHLDVFGRYTWCNHFSRRVSFPIWTRQRILVLKLTFHTLMSQSFYGVEDPWISCGDFNCLMADSEMLRASCDRHLQMMDFEDLLADCELFDAVHL